MSNLPKIVLLGPAHPYRGGIADTQEALFNTLKKQQFEVSLLTFATLYPKLFFPGKSQLRQQDNVFQPQFQRLLHTYHPLYWWKAARWIHQKKADVVVVRYWTPFVAVCWWGIRKFLKKSIPMIGMVDNWNPHESNLFNMPLRALFANSCSQFISLSEHVGRQIQESRKEPVHFGFHPIASELPKKQTHSQARKILDLPQDKIIVAFVGLIRDYKGLPLLIDAFAIATKKEPKLLLCISGEFYSSKKTILDQIHRLGIEEKVKVNPYFLSSDSLRSSICAANLIVQPYKKASQSGIIPLAYAYETPLLVSAIPGLQDPVLNDKTGEAVARDKNLWAEALLRMTREKTNGSYLTALRKAKKKYRWEAFTKILLNSIQQ